MVFYRKYRPQKLADLVGQEEISKNLLAQLVGGKISHGYLFWGPRGTGKTSTARIFAKAINCEAYRPATTDYDKKKSGGQKSVDGLRTYGEPCNKCVSCESINEGSSLDLIEIDAASNRGIDEIRDLREKVKLSPVASPFKVYIIDEAHMLTNEAFNALLKTLEEPPAHAVFILATTEYSKLPPTIVSRLQKFNFKRAGLADLKRAVLEVAKGEKIKISEVAAGAIAEASDGSYRDAISILDQLGGGGKIEEADVRAAITVSGWNTLSKLAYNLAQSKLKDAVGSVELMAGEGADFGLFVKQFVLFLEKILMLKIGIDNEADLDPGQLEDLKQLSTLFEFEDLQILIRLMLIADGEMKIYPMPHMPVVLAFCKYVGEVKTGDELGDGSKVSEVSNMEKETGEEVLKGTKVLSASATSSAKALDVKKATVDKKVTNVEREITMETGTKKSQKGVVSLSEVEKNWADFLNRVRLVNAHVVALLRATRPSSCDGDYLTLEVFYRFHKDKLEEPKILRMLDSKMEEVLGKNIRLKFVLADRGATPTPVVNKSNVMDLAGDELEKIAQEIFSK